jgi:hypothetical protein
MKKHIQAAGYNRPNLYMSGRSSGWLRLGCLAVLLLLSSFLGGSTFTDAAGQLARKIAAVTGPGAIALQFKNRSSLDDKTVADVRAALESALRVEGVSTVAAEQAMGTVTVTLSESMREYVWSAEITVGSDERRIALVSLARPRIGPATSASMPVALRKTLLYAQEQPILDAATIEMSSGARLVILDSRQVAAYHQLGGRWEPEVTIPIAHTRPFPRDLRGRIFLRHDHLFDVYLPGTFCRSSATVPLTLACNDSDDPWPLTAEDTSARAFFTPFRNFFTGALSPPIGKVASVPAFYTTAAIPRSNYTLWVFAGVDGSVYTADGIATQVVRGAKWGSDLAALRSACGTGTQVLVSEAGDPEHDQLRAFEIPDREPVLVSAGLEFDGRITALWADASNTGALAIVRRGDTGLYEAYRISISCS